jgi:hypothetical protein
MKCTRLTDPLHRLRCAPPKFVLACVGAATANHDKAETDHGEAS